MDKSINNILRPERVQVGVRVSDKSAALRHLSELIAEQFGGVTASEVDEAFTAREALGSTGIGNGMAIPHCRMNCGEGTCGVLVRLAAPIDFDSIDREPVDVLFAILTPEGEAEQHLQTLAMLAQRFNQPAFRQALRDAADERALYEAALADDPVG